jgi:hypothetical protein
MTEFSIYQEAAEAALNKFYGSSHRQMPMKNDVPHITNIARSIMMHRDGLIPGGSFVTAVIENDLEGAINRADSVCIENIPFFVHCKQFIHPKHS